MSATFSLAASVASSFRREACFSCNFSNACQIKWNQRRFHVHLHRCIGGMHGWRSYNFFKPLACLQIGWLSASQNTLFCQKMNFETRTPWSRLRLYKSEPDKNITLQGSATKIYIITHTYLNIAVIFDSVHPKLNIIPILFPISVGDKRSRIRLWFDWWITSRTLCEERWKNRKV